MTIDVKRHGKFTSATYIEDNTRIESGMMDDEERDKLVETLINAAFELGPTSGCMAWFIEVLNKCGIEVEKTNE